jgi:hypothetical protein
LDLIGENIGIDYKKKSRLKRNAALENSASEDHIKQEFT